jgi:hypothetical protein
MAEASELLNHRRSSDHRSRLLPFGLRVALLIRRALAHRDFARETCPAMLVITSSPTLDPESSVTSLWRPGGSSLCQLAAFQLHYHAIN